MAKSVTYNKRENEKKKQARRAEKQKKKEDRKLLGKANSFDDMIAYVDENGVITSTPPELNPNKEEIKQEDILISTPKKEDIETPTVLKGLMNQKDMVLSKTLVATRSIFFMLVTIH